ncbi:MAG: nucleotidyl transferase AbiEii/AbiGii toxin family protein [Verrucomicrobiales bacterium]|nr:nucleotidyl transferase AbiEii/AbiGii toxin family protein [Verrucomicrobiales bacterium]
MLHYESIPEAVHELLTSLARSAVVDGFALGGGTSLALRFGHRISVDLDFFTEVGFEAGELTRREGFPSTHTVVGRSEGSLTIACGDVKIDFLRHAYPVLEPLEIEDGVRLLSLADVTAMKLNAIANRGSKKDFFDLVRILDELSLDACLDLFEKKYLNTDRFVAIRSLVWFEDAEEEPAPVVPTGLGWGEVKQRIRGEVSRLG